MKKFLPYVFVGLNALCMVVGLFLVYSSTIGFESPVIKEEQEIARLEQARKERDENPIIYTMDPFTVNLNGYPKRIIKTEVNLVLLDKAGFEQVVRLGSKARDSIVRILNGKTFADLETVQGKLFLKDEIASRLNELLVEGVIKDVYFSEFIVK
jgi:flagellar FliL protein